MVLCNYQTSKENVNLRTKLQRTKVSQYENQEIYNTYSYLNDLNTLHKLIISSLKCTGNYLY